MLRRCPLLDAANRYPQVVCQVHLEIVRGAMDVLGGSAERTAITPFVEPGACRLHFGPRSRPGGPAAFVAGVSWTVLVSGALRNGQQDDGVFECFQVVATVGNNEQVPR